MNQLPAIVIVTHKRTESLKRLLYSITKSEYHSHDIPLVISIDFSDNQREILKIAEQFEWKYGEKEIICHNQNLGLKKHIISCGDLTSRYQSIIMLEDDLYVSPSFYLYACKALDYYERNENIAGIALYSPNWNETSKINFHPLNNGTACYYMKIPCSWGQAWTINHWNGFKDYLKGAELEDTQLPENVQTWNSETSWKKAFYGYLIKNIRHIAYPYLSYTTNFNDPGEHYTQKLSLFQTALVPTCQYFKFEGAIENLFIYDQFGELESDVFKRYNSELNFDFDVDIYGSKRLNAIEKPYLLSIKECLKPIRSFDNSMLPLENNILFGIKGDFVHLGKTEDFREGNDIWRKKETIIENNSKVPISQIKESVKGKLQNTFDYKIGNLLLKPLRFFRR